MSAILWQDMLLVLIKVWNLRFYTRYNFFQVYAYLRTAQPSLSHISIVMNWPDVPVWLQYLVFRTRLSWHADHPNQQVEQHHICVHGVQRPTPIQTSQNRRLLPQLFPHRTRIPHMLRAVNIVKIYAWMPQYLISQRRGKEFRLNLQILRVRWLGFALCALGWVWSWTQNMFFSAW